jgi:hypothetical protein
LTFKKSLSGPEKTASCPFLKSLNIKADLQLGQLAPQTELADHDKMSLSNYLQFIGIGRELLRLVDTD